LLEDAGSRSTIGEVEGLVLEWEDKARLVARRSNGLAKQNGSLPLNSLQKRRG